jgi:hypothetical protein
MGRAVIFDREALQRVIEVCPSYETPVLVVKPNLRAWPWQTGQDEKQAEPRFHDALGGRLGKLYGPPKTSCARVSPVRVDPRIEIPQFEEALM